MKFRVEFDVPINNAKALDFYSLGLKNDLEKALKRYFGVLAGNITISYVDEHGKSVKLE